MVSPVSVAGHITEKMLPLEGTTGVASLATQAGSYLVLTRTPAQHCEPTTQGAHVVNASRTGLKMVGHAARITGAANVVNASVVSASLR